jgi:hypothetical protein
MHFIHLSDPTFWFIECRQSFVMKPSNKYDAHNIKALRYHKASCKFCWLTRILIQEFDEPISRKHSIIFYYSQTCWARAVNVKLSLLGVLSETDCCLTWEPRTIWWVYEWICFVSCLFIVIILWTFLSEPSQNYCRMSVGILFLSVGKERILALYKCLV